MLEIHSSVVRKVAAHAVRLVPGAVPDGVARVDGAGVGGAIRLDDGRPDRGLDDGPADGPGGAESGAAVPGGPDVAVAVRVALAYPAPLRAAAAEVRRCVAGEVERITGYRVRSVLVTVTALRGGPGVG
ncbi:hypothetical protein [Saccharothrix syringae]|uniref:Asp23/Gls24 family envelope stress response protein n=1 Tax=Saccharothrix syringae TaxID=103733 RepID=A0A5Q0GW18_SACSY|nr:hypothetical protein [Saccharothrix syringae]QFZ17650.1 hypothetical protein EKG83_09290 [Saccharothrix syringae]